MKKPQNIFLIGPTGAGKSTIGKLLAKELKLNFYDSDQEIAKKAGADIPWIFDVEGEQGFRQREEQAINELTALPNIVLATGGGAVLSANNRAMLAARGNVIYLQVSLAQQYQRVEYSQDRPLLKGADLQKALLNMRAQRDPWYQQLADIIVATDQVSTRAIVEAILNKLDEHMLSKNH
jgi:shikimate kinase